MDRETNDLIARQYLSEKNLSRVEPREFAAWAALEITRGHDLGSLRRLAAASDGDDTSDRHFRECVEALGWEIPPKKTALKRHSESVMQSMVDGELQPYDGCSHLYIISIYLGHPDYLYNWNGLFWAREDLDEEELNELILEEARRELAGEVTPINKLPRHDDDDEETPGFWDRIREKVRWL